MDWRLIQSDEGIDMKKVKQSIVAIVIATGLTALPLVMSPVSSASSSLSYRTTLEVPTIDVEMAPARSTTLSWVEAQQRRYANSANPADGTLSAEQQNKLVTMIRLMTLEL